MLTGAVTRRRRGPSPSNSAEKRPLQLQTAVGGEGQRLPRAGDPGLGAGGHLGGHVGGYVKLVQRQGVADPRQPDRGGIGDGAGADGGLDGAPVVGHHHGNLHRRRGGRGQRVGVGLGEAELVEYALGGDVHHADAVDVAAGQRRGVQRHQTGDGGPAAGERRGVAAHHVAVEPGAAEVLARSE